MELCSFSPSILFMVGLQVFTVFSTQLMFFPFSFLSTSHISWVTIVHNLLFPC